MIRSFRVKTLDDCLCCPQPNIIESNGYWVCTSCGATIDEPVLSKTGRRAFTKEEKVSRVHYEVVRNKWGPRTVIDKRDIKKLNIPPKQKSVFYRLADKQFWGSGSKSRNYSIAHSSLTKIKSLPKHVIATAWQIYKRCVDEMITMGRSIDLVLAASIYTSTLLFRSPLLMFDVVRELAPINPNLKKNEILRVYNEMIVLDVLDEFFDSKLVKQSVIEAYAGFGRSLEENHVFRPVKPKLTDYCFTYCNRINMSPRLTHKAISFLEELIKSDDFKVSGKNPAGLIAGVIYSAFNGVPKPDSDEIIAVFQELDKYTTHDLFKADGLPDKRNVTQRMMSAYMGVTEVTMRKVTKYLKKKRTA